MGRMEQLPDVVAGNLGYIYIYIYIWGAKMSHSGGLPRMIFLQKPNIEGTLLPVGRPMQYGVHCRALAREKCRANINVRSTEFVIALKK